MSGKQKTSVWQSKNECLANEKRMSGRRKTSVWQTKTNVLKTTPNVWHTSTNVWQAKQDVKGIYRSFVRILSNRTVATQLPRLFGLYLDFVRTEVEEVEDGVLRATLHGVPAAMAGWFATIFPSYMETILEVGGFDAGPLPLRGPGPDGEAHGVRTVWLGFRMDLRTPPR